VQQAQRLGDFASNAVLIMLGWQLGGRDLCEEKKLEIRLLIDSDLSQKLG
jgi:hypothetical protein